jgi:oligopeptide/dipeptide ABC transporter ATP-binding protein
MRRGIVKAVDGVSLAIDRGENLGLVGESGCGKSVTGLSILRLVPHPGRIVAGQIIFEGQDLLGKNQEEMRKIRGGRISMIFQDPTAALDPVFTVGDQLSEALSLHQGLNREEVVGRAIQLLEMVGIPSAAIRLHDYPHQLSGGMRQRVMIAMALSCNPSLLIADEPTTNLDVTIQAQILELMKDLRKRFDSAILFITHDLGVVAEICDRVAVMYAGEIVESGDLEDIFYDARHPYSKGLLACLPRGKGHRLSQIGGNVPDLVDPPSGCKFHPRCPNSADSCRKMKPPSLRVGDEHFVSCHRERQ